MLALVSNYQIPQELDYSEPYTIMLEALKEAFGESKKIGWWLEHPLNHAPKDFMVRGQYHDLRWCKGVDKDVSSGLDLNRRGYAIGTRHMITMIKRLHISEGTGRKWN